MNYFLQNTKEEKAKLLHQTRMYCTLCEEDISFALEHHYTTVHLGTYSPFAYLEQFVTFSSDERRIGRELLKQELLKEFRYADDSLVSRSEVHRIILKVLEEIKE